MLCFPRCVFYDKQEFYVKFLQNLLDLLYNLSNIFLQKDNGFIFSVGERPSSNG